MKRCPDCRTEQPDDAGQCSWCGRDLSQVVATAPAVTVVSDGRARAITAVGTGGTMLLQVTPILILGVVLSMLVDTTAGLVLIGVCAALVALAVGLPLMMSSPRADAALCGVIALIALWIAVGLARSERPSAWFECLIVSAVAVVYLVRAWRKLKT